MLAWPLRAAALLGVALQRLEVVQAGRLARALLVAELPVLPPAAALQLVLPVWQPMR